MHRSCRSLRFALCTLVFLSALAGPAVAHAANGWDLTELAPGYSATISGSRIAWCDYTDAGWGVRTQLLGGASAAAITTSVPFADIAVSQDAVAWIAAGNLFVPGMWKAGAVSQAGRGYDSAWNIALSGDTAVWQSVEQGGSQAFQWTLGTPPSIVSTDPNVPGFTRTPAVSDGEVVWTGGDESGRYLLSWTAGGGTTTVTQGGDANGPRVSQGRVVWLDRDPGGSADVRTRKAGEATATIISHAATDCSGAVVSGERVAWLCADEAGNQQVFTWKSGDTTATQISQGETQPRALDISGDRVVWEFRSPQGAGEIATWHAGDTQATQVTTDRFLHTEPHVSGDTIACSGRGTLTDSVVFVARPGTGAVTLGQAGFMNTLAYDLASRRTSRFRIRASMPAVRAKLVLHRGRALGGDVTLTDRTVANKVDDPFTILDWDGMVAGKRLPTGNYGWTVTVSKNGHTATMSGSILICRVYFVMKGTASGGVARIHKGYMRTGPAKLYIRATTAAASDRLRISVTGPLAYSAMVGSWTLGATSPLHVNAYLTNATGPKGTGTQTFAVTGTHGVGYDIAVIQ
jgi:hypothetical protein